MDSPESKEEKEESVKEELKESDEDNNNPTQTDISPLIDINIVIPSDIPFLITWELAKKIRIDMAYQKWHRSVEMDEKYNQNKQQVSLTHDSMSSFLLNDIFDIKLIKNEDGKWSKNPKISLNKMTKWTRNRFRYNLIKEISHDLLWCTYKLSKSEITNCIKEYIPSNHDIIWWVNPMKFRSVPGLYHVQVLHIEMMGASK